MKRKYNFFWNEMSMAWSGRLWELNNWFNCGIFTDRWGSAGSCQCALISEHDSTPKLGNGSNLFTKVEDLDLFFLSIILNPIVFQRKFNPSVSASSNHCCFVRAIWCHKAWWVSTKPLASQQKAIDLSKELMKLEPQAS